MKTLLAVACIALVAAVVVLAACASGPSARPPVNDADAAGERLYRSHCGACHRLRSPSEQTRDRWAWAVDHYGPRAHLAEADRPLVLEYLQRRAKDAPAAASEAR